MDSSLSEEGRTQAKELGEKLKELEIKYVFCSPLIRCLETTYLSLENHPKKENIHVIIYPYITEVIHGAQDLSLEIGMKKEKYNEKSLIRFDWSYFDYHFPAPIADYYYLYFVDNVDEKNEKIQNLIAEIHSCETKKEGLYSEFLKHYILNKQRPESLSHLFHRACIFKDFLKKFKELECLSDTEFTKILVVTHSAFIRMSTTEIAYKMDKVDCYPEDCYRPSNCEIISINI